MQSNLKTINITSLERDIENNVADKIVIVSNLKDRKPDQIKHFKSPEEFLDYYRLNQMVVESSTTPALNRLYKIDGHKIGRRKNVIKIIPIKNSPDEITVEDLTEQINSLRDAIDDIMERIQPLDDIPGIKKNLKQVINKVNALNEQ